MCRGEPYREPEGALPAMGRSAAGTRLPLGIRVYPPNISICCGRRPSSPSFLRTAASKRVASAGKACVVAMRQRSRAPWAATSSSRPPSSLSLARRDATRGISRNIANRNGHTPRRLRFGCATPAYAEPFRHYDAVHPNTLYMGVVGNQIVTDVNTKFGFAMRTISETQLLDNAGL